MEERGCMHTDFCKYYITWKIVHAMDWFGFIAPAVITSLSISVSFFDDAIIKTKVMSELNRASFLNVDQKASIAIMCDGAATLVAFFAGIGLVFGNALLALRFFHGNTFIVTASAIALVLVFIHAVRVSATGKLSDIDDLKVFGPLTQGALLRIELIVLNVIVLFGLVYGISVSK